MNNTTPANTIATIISNYGKAVNMDYVDVSRVTMGDSLMSDYSGHCDHCEEEASIKVKEAKDSLSVVCNKLGIEAWPDTYNEDTKNIIMGKVNNDYGRFWKAIGWINEKKEEVKFLTSEVKRIVNETIPLINGEDGLYCSCCGSKVYRIDTFKPRTDKDLQCVEDDLYDEGSKDYFVFKKNAMKAFKSGDDSWFEDGDWEMIPELKEEMWESDAEAYRELLAGPRKSKERRYNKPGKNIHGKYITHVKYSKSKWTEYLTSKGFKSSEEYYASKKLESKIIMDAAIMAAEAGLVQSKKIKTVDELAWMAGV